MRLERIIRSVAPRAITVTDELKERYFDAERRRYAERCARNPRFDEASLERLLAQTQFPPTIPAHANRMYADALGHLSLQEYVLASAGLYVAAFVLLVLSLLAAGLH
jgi:hypothetical protein